MKTRNFLIAAVILVLISAVYLFGLNLSPVHLNQDEMMFGLNAYSIAKHGTDYYGNPYPFYFWHLGSFWATPVSVYVGSLFLRFLPFSEWSIRVPSVFAGLVSILFLALLAKKIFKDSFYTFLALILAGTVPVLFINSRLFFDCVWTVPFVVLWLVTLKSYSDKRNSGVLFLSGLILGVGIHSYHAAKLIMPLYFLTTIVYLFLAKKAKVFDLLALAAGFALPIIAFLPWLKIHPDTLLNQVNYLGSLDKTVKVSSGIWGVFNFERLRDFFANYLSYFSPRILFVEGDRSLIHSTGRIGAFSFAMAFLLLFGIMETLRNKNDWFGKLILFGFLTYPLAPAIVNDPQRISRGLIVIPFVVLLGLYGVRFLFNQKERIFKYLVIVLVSFIILDFGIFLGDYFGDYRVRSSSWFNNSIGSMYESVIKSTTLRKVDRIYVDQNIYFAQTYFEFYQLKFGKDFKNQTVYFDPRFEDFSKFPGKSLVAIQVADIPTKPEKIGKFEKVEIIRELSGYETFLVYYKE